MESLGIATPQDLARFMDKKLGIERANLCTRCRNIG